MTPKERMRAGHICIKLEPAFKIMWTSMWPGGCCVPTSLLTAPILRASLEIDFVVACGWAHEDRRPHAWIQSPAGDIIDPTYGQFCQDFAHPFRLVASSEPDLLGHEVYKILTLEEEEQARRDMKPRSTSKGWLPGSALPDLFIEIRRQEAA